MLRTTLLAAAGIANIPNPLKPTTGIIFAEVVRTGGLFLAIDSTAHVPLGPRRASITEATIDAINAADARNKVLDISAKVRPMPKDMQG